MSFCQADQLAVAIRSPIAPQEIDNDPCADVVRESPVVSVLVCKREVW